MLNNSDYNACMMLKLHRVYFQSRKCWFNKEVARRNLFCNISHAVSPQMTCYLSNNAHVWVRSLSSQMSIRKIHRKTFDKLRINDALLKKESKQLLTWILSCYKENLCYKHCFLHFLAELCPHFSNKCSITRIIMLAWCWNFTEFISRAESVDLTKKLRGGTYFST